ncbi:MAG: methyl-accepting chemotaxis protein [Candidatus Omnitrophica bacterium]|nr:methyl-accepting chemotaxis protein [Candidatus Omnitrophota bacterium]
MDDQRNRRRNYYIKKDFQLSFILKFCLIVAIGAIISGGIIYWMSKSTVTTSFENLRLVIKSTADYMLPAVLLAGFIVIVVTGIASIFITLFTSHKIAGPLYRIEKDIREVAAGNLAQAFNLRQGDEIKPIAEALDLMVHYLREEVSLIKRDIAELESLSVSGGTSREIREKIKTLRARIEKFKT